MKKILIFYSNRSEEGLLGPVATELFTQPWAEGSMILAPDLHNINLRQVYGWAYDQIETKKPDLVFAPFDRVQMLMVATAAMVQNVPVAQLHAGDLAGPGTWDDKVRFAITSIADLIFCNGEESTIRAWEATKWSQIDVDDVGSTAFDGVQIDNYLCPITSIGLSRSRTNDFIRPFDLVLYNPPTAQQEKIHGDLDRIFSLIKGHTAVWIGPNSDPGSDIIEGRAEMASIESGGEIIYYPQVPRPRFLGLMQNCERFIGNSSSMFMEAPAFLKEEQIVNIGNRNRDRTFIKVRIGGSKRIVEHIKKFLGESD